MSKKTLIIIAVVVVGIIVIIEIGKRINITDMLAKMHGG